MISEVTVGTTNILSKLTFDFLSKYDCIIYDLLDSGTTVNTESQDIKQYINNGGSFLVTHDRWDEDYGPLELIDSERKQTNADHSMSKKAKVSRYGHSIFDSFYDLTDWRVINIAYAHKSNHLIKNDINNSARVVMELDCDNETGIKYDYLLVNEIGKGRIAYWAAGHSFTISNDEQLLFINIVSWLTKFKN